MGDETVFDKIIRREIPADIVYEDDRCLAFRDVQPQAPVHILIIPKERLVGLQAAEAGPRSQISSQILRPTFTPCISTTQGVSPARK